MRIRKIHQQTFNWADKVKDLDLIIERSKRKADDLELIRLNAVQRLDRWKQEIIFLYAMYQSFNIVADIIGTSRETARLYYKQALADIDNLTFKQ